MVKCINFLTVKCTVEQLVSINRDFRALAQMYHLEVYIKEHEHIASQNIPEIQKETSMVFHIPSFRHFRGNLQNPFTTRLYVQGC